MVDKEIFGALKASLERGETLKRGMMTLYSAGYKKEDIEEGARKLLKDKRERQLHPVESFPIDIRKDVPKSPTPPVANEINFPNPPEQKIQKVEPKPQIPQPVVQKPIVLQKPLVVQKPVQQIQKIKPYVPPTKPYPVYLPIQRVSDYGTEITARERTIISILIFLLIFLVVDLGLIFLFKDEIINFFGKFFG